MVRNRVNMLPVDNFCCFFLSCLVLQRRQALSGAQSSVNKAASVVSQTCSSAGTEPVVKLRDDSGATWEQDGTPKGRVLGKEKSRRRLLLKAARTSLERAQGKLAAKGEDLKKKTDRGLVQAGGSLARGLRKILPKPDKGEESDVVRNARLIADCAVSATEVARIRNLRCEQQRAGRYNGRQTRATTVDEPIFQKIGETKGATTEPNAKVAHGAGGGLDAGAAPVQKEVPCATADEVGATSASSSSSLTFDLVGDEELLYAYQAALDALEEGDQPDDSDETEIIALAVSQMQLHPDLVEFAVTRLYELVGLDPDVCAQSSGVQARDIANDGLVARVPGLPAAPCQGEDSWACPEVGGNCVDDDDDDEYISAYALNSTLAGRVAKPFAS